MLVTCSNCQSKIKVPDSAAGKKGKCPKCGTVIAIPMVEEPQADEAAADVPADAPPAGEASPNNPFAFDEGPAAAGADDDEAPRKKGKSKPASYEEDDGPAELDDEGKPKKQGESLGLPITALILGILSLLCSCGSFNCPCIGVVPLLCGIGALVTGFLGMNKGGKNGKIMAIVGMSLGGFSLLLALLLVTLGLIFGGLGVMGNLIGR